jgi:hypothetical protein
MARLLDNEAFRWIAGGLLGALVMVGSWAFVSVEARVGQIEQGIIGRSERIATVEAVVNTLKEQADRQEDKLDWLIEKEVNRGSDRRPPPPRGGLRQQP